MRNTLFIIFLVLCGVLNATEAVTTLQLIGGANAYNIVYKANDTKAKENAEQFRNAIKNKTGVELSIVTDATAATPYEIILGPTNARQEIHTQNGALSKFSYRIGIAGTKVVITASDYNHMVLGLKRFESAILKDGRLAGDGYLKINTDMTQQADFSHTQATLRTILANGIAYEPLTTELVYTQAKDGDYGNAQGICTDGKYVYIVMRPGNDTASEKKAKIYKVLMSDSKWTYDSKSPVVLTHCGHGNDMCYDYVNKCVICLGWNAKESSSTTIKTYTKIDPNTLKEISSGNAIPHKAVEIDYNKELGQYVTICGGDVRILDGDLNIIKSISRTMPSGWTEQGMGTDAQYFYSPYWKGSAGYTTLVVSEWATGEHITNLEVDLDIEPESLIEVDGVYYLGCNNSGCKIYRIVINLKYTAATF